MGSIVYKLGLASLLVVQNYLVELNGFSTRVVDPNFAELPPRVRKQLARNRQKRVCHQEPTPQTVCVCGVSEKLERHHIIPPRFGGTNVRENILWVCHKCHIKIHGGE